LEKGTKVPLKVLKRSRADYTKNSAVIFLLIKRGEEIILLPGDDFLIEQGDQMLIVCNDESEEDLAYILNNYYEFNYVLHGKEKISGVLGWLYKE